MFDREGKNIKWIVMLLAGLFGGHVAKETQKVPLTDHIREEKDDKGGHAQQEASVVVKKSPKHKKSQINITHVGYAIGGTLAFAGLIGLYFSRRNNYTVLVSQSLLTPDFQAYSSTESPGVIDPNIFSPTLVISDHNFPLLRTNSLQQTKESKLSQMLNQPFLELGVKTPPQMPYINIGAANELKDLFKRIPPGDQHRHEKSGNVDKITQVDLDINHYMDINDQILRLNRLDNKHKEVMTATKIIRKINENKLVIETNAQLFSWEKTFENATQEGQHNEMQPDQDGFHEESIRWQDVMLTKKDVQPTKENRKAYVDHCIERVNTKKKHYFNNRLIGDFSGEFIEVNYAITNLEKLIMLLKLVTREPDPNHED